MLNLHSLAQTSVECPYKWFGRLIAKYNLELLDGGGFSAEARACMQVAQSLRLVANTVIQPP
jgi:hypothetical protein